MSHEPKVTIWIPSYNHARFLPAALDSALAQTYTDFEVVVVDDGSTDDSLAIAEAYAARHPDRVRVFTHPGHRNRGISETVNLGFEKSRGRYVMGLPSDDVLRPEKLAVQVAYLDGHPEIGWLYGPAEYMDADGETWPELGLMGKDVTRDPDPLESLIGGNIVPSMTVMMRRELVERVGPHDPSLIYSDWEFWSRMMAHAEAGFLPAPLVKHRVHNYNTSLGVETRVNAECGLEVMRSLRRRAEAGEGGLRRPRIRAWLDVQIAYHLFCAGRGDDSAARRSLAAAFESDPTLRRDAGHFLRWMKLLTFNPLYTTAVESPDGGFALWVARNLPPGLRLSLGRRAAAVHFARELFFRGDLGPRERRRAALRCLLSDPARLGDGSLRYALIESVVGARMAGATRRYLLPVYRLIRPAPESPHPALRLADRYGEWVKEYDTLTDSDREAIRARARGPQYHPLISLVMTVEEADEERPRRAVESVRRQLYANWELCIAGARPTGTRARRVLEECAAGDPRIKVAFAQRDGRAAALNSALDLADGEFVAFLGQDDEIPEHALSLVAEELKAHGDASLIYSDEDRLDVAGARRDPHFKPDWSPDLFYSYDMISSLAVYRRSILESVGGFREGYEGSEGYDLALRVVERIPAAHIRHITHVLYHRRGTVAPGERPGEERARETARGALRSHLERRGVAATVADGHCGSLRVVYPVPVPAPPVSVIIGTRDRVSLLRGAVEGVLEQTSYPSVELVIVDNQSADPATLAFLRDVQKDPRVKVVPYDAPFNFSAINNLGVSRSSGEMICLLNNDIKVISPGWLEEMVAHAARAEIGAVGAKLYYQDGRIQHAGIVLGIGGVASHLHKSFPREVVGYAARTHVVQNFAAVTGACMLMRREVFNEVGGLDEVNLPVAYNDIDLCLRIWESGYRILWTPYAELYHLESASRGPDDIPEQLPRLRREQDYVRRRWGDLLKSDPYSNPNLDLEVWEPALAFPPRAPRPWARAEAERAGGPRGAVKGPLL